MITLTYLSTVLELPDALFWADELSWQPVQQSVERGITGALIVQAAARLAGRPITLQPYDDNSAWMQRATLEQLAAWATVPGLEMQLELRGASRDVVFRHHDGSAIEARPLLHYSDVLPGDYYLVTLRFMEV